MTLYYDRNADEVYQDAFSAEIEGTQWPIKSSCILIGAQGVAAAVDLTSEQAEWYRISQEAMPHITLAVNVNHEARELGPMTKTLLALTGWQYTQIPNLFFSPSTKAYKLMTSAEDVAVLEHRQIERFHGREKTDHPDSAALLDSLPEGLWSQGFLSLHPSHHI